MTDDENMDEHGNRLYGTALDSTVLHYLVINVVRDGSPSVGSTGKISLHCCCQDLRGGGKSEEREEEDKRESKEGKRRKEKFEE